MQAEPEVHPRRAIRLAGFDYAQPGAYFVTCVSHERMCIFGEVAEGEMRLNRAGKIVERCWLAIPQHFSQVELDAFVVMPNHVHGIIVITDTVGANDYSPLQFSFQPFSPHQPFRSPSKTVGSVVRGFKIGVTKWFRVNTDVYTVWQRNYYEHIIRNEEALNSVRQYILDNPLHWDLDLENPQRKGDDELWNEMFR